MMLQVTWLGAKFKDFGQNPKNTRLTSFAYLLELCICVSQNTAYSPTLHIALETESFSKADCGMAQGSATPGHKVKNHQDLLKVLIWISPFTEEHSHGNLFCAWFRPLKQQFSNRDLGPPVVCGIMLRVPPTLAFLLLCTPSPHSYKYAEKRRLFTQRLLLSFCTLQKGCEGKKRGGRRPEKLSAERLMEASVIRT